MESLVFVLRVHLEWIHEGHLVKVKVTGAKKREIPYSRNVKLRWENKSGSIEDTAVMFECNMGFSAMA